ncbi:MAG: MobC family plasmid mobilization relaxosome protein [Lachnospiraceae bacterium]|nr:MobC family plasmid mobilization relaxosome protein [Ruminococcus sp.]MCM1276816.1 MobC family plasmid mobilization relaxosome protein [Lachnospiraceae bacterium]
MRKYRQVKRKEVIFSTDEWKVIESKAAEVMMKTGEYIRRIALTGHVNYYNMEAVGDVMKALRIIGANINQLVKKANETHNVYANDVEDLRKEVDSLCRFLNQYLSMLPLSAA